MVKKSSWVDRPRARRRVRRRGRSGSGFDFFLLSAACGLYERLERASTTWAVTPGTSSRIRRPSQFRTAKGGRSFRGSVESKR